MEPFKYYVKKNRLHLARGMYSIFLFIELDYELLSHHKFSPDLTFSNYFLFPNSKKCLGDTLLCANDEFIVHTNVLSEDIDKYSYYLEGALKFEKMLEEYHVGIVCLDSFFFQFGIFLTQKLRHEISPRVSLFCTRYF